MKEKEECFTREYTFENGKKSIWTYDLSKNPYGPISVDTTYPTDYKSEGEIQETLPLTKRTYWNPETESMVAYGRAKQLGLI